MATHTPTTPRVRVAAFSEAAEAAASTILIIGGAIIIALATLI